MQIIQILGLALTAVVFLLLLRQEKPVMAVLFSISFGIVVFWMMLEPLQDIILALKHITEKAEADLYFMNHILKIVGIAYLAEFASVLCTDAGEQAVAKKIEFAAKILIAGLALPMMASILDVLFHLLPA